MANKKKKARKETKNLVADPSLWEEVEEFRAWKQNANGIDISLSQAVAWLCSQGLKRWDDGRKARVITEDGLPDGLVIAEFENPDEGFGL